MSRSVRWIVITGIVGALAALLYFVFRPQPIPVDAAEVVVAPMRVTVEEDGQTRIRERYVISAPLPGRLQRIELDPGDAVVAGDSLLAVIDPTDPSLLDVRALAEAEARVRAAEAALRRAESVLEGTQSSLEFAAKERSRVLGASERAAVSRHEVDEAQWREETARQDVRSAEFARDISQFELEQAQAALLRARPEQDADLSQFRIVAPVSGVVLRLFQESMSVVTAGTPLLEVGDPGDLEVVVDVLSTDAVKIQAGAPVIIERWGGGEPLRGAVRLVEPAAFTKISSLGVEEQRVNVIVDLLTPIEQRETLGDAYRIEAAIVLWQDEDVLQVPSGALFRRGHAWSVFVIADGKAIERAITIGHRNAENAEALTNLEAGEQVILYPGDAVAQGTRVAPRR